MLQRFMILYGLWQSKRHSINIESSFSPIREIQELLVCRERISDYLLLGDSVSERISKNDTDSRSFKEILASVLAPSPTSAVTFSAYTFRHYLLLIKVRKLFPSPPKFVVFPVNLRSFSPQWFFHPAFQRALHIDEMRDFLRSNGVVVPHVLESNPPNLSILKYVNARYHSPLMGNSDVGEILERLQLFPKQHHHANMERSKVLFGFHYLSHIEQDHPLFRMLSELIDSIRSLGAIPIIYVTPINQKAGAILWGEKFNICISEQVESIRCFVNQKGVDLFDYSRLIPQSGFFHDFESTEHLNQAGRLMLALELSRSVSKITFQNPCRPF